MVVVQLSGVYVLVDCVPSLQIGCGEVMGEVLPAEYLQSLLNLLRYGFSVLEADVGAEHGQYVLNLPMPVSQRDVLILPLEKGLQLGVCDEGT